jgi:A118 family predicted phage portal protein
MGLINFAKGVWGRLFPIKDIRTALGVTPAISQTMVSKIERWYNCYAGKAYWLDDDKNIISLRLEKAITREFSNIVLNEMTAKVSLPALDEIFSTALKNINEELQKGLATGAMIIKPLGEDKVQFVSQRNFVPVEYDERGRLLKVVFVEYKTINDKYYTRLEYHDLHPTKGLTITNTAYESISVSALGRRIPLEKVDEWANLESEISYPLMLRPAFGYYRNPIDNTIDGSPVGISIFENALHNIRLADIQFGRLDWEFESGERFIHANETLLKDGQLAKGRDRLYHYVDSDDENLLQEFSPVFRQSDLISGLEEYKRNIEFSVGLSYGDISNPQTVAKTATEIKSAKDRKYNTVTAIQKNLKDCLEDLVYALAFFNSMATKKYDFVCDFKDSILTDEDTERQRDIQDLNLGILRPEEYRAKWYSEDAKTALNNLPKSADVIE